MWHNDLKRACSEILDGYIPMGVDLKLLAFIPCDCDTIYCCSISFKNADITLYYKILVRKREEPSSTKSRQAVAEPGDDTSRKEEPASSTSTSLRHCITTLRSSNKWQWQDASN
jgi:hypothetical protein